MEFDKKKYMREYIKKYRLEHKDKFKQYRENYKQRVWEDAIREYQKKYREEKWDELKDKKKKYRDSHREIISIKKKVRQDKKWYVPIHNKTASLIRKLDIRPTHCTICGNTWVIEAHHPSYKKRSEVVFCCSSCHKNIHLGHIKKYQIVNLEYPKTANLILNQYL